MSKASQVDELVAEIATASREQSQGIDQVNTAVTQMDKVTQTNAAAAEECASASEELNAQAATLRDIVGELQTLVTGSSTVHTGGREVLRTRPYTPPSTRRAAASTPPPRAAIGGNRPALTSSKKKAPKDEIPMDDDFRDF